MSMLGVWRSTHGGRTDVALVADGRTVGVDQGDVSATGGNGTPTERSADCAGGDPLGDADRDTLAGPAFEVSPTEPLDHGLGRSQGGFSSKIHLVCDDRWGPTRGEM